MDDFPPPPSSPPPHCSSLPPSLPLRRSALEEINRGWSRYKSSAPRFPIHSPPHSSPPLSTAHYLCRPSAFLLFLLISRFLSRGKQRKSSARMRSEEGTGHSSPRRTLGTRRVHTCETLFRSSRPQFISDSETKRSPSRGGLSGSVLRKSVRWRRGKRSRASRRNERSRRVLPEVRLFLRRRTPAECKKNAMSSVRRRRFGPRDS